MVIAMEVTSPCELETVPVRYRASSIHATPNAFKVGRPDITDISGRRQKP
jgi:hypothetical protein